MARSSKRAAARRRKQTTVRRAARRRSQLIRNSAIAAVIAGAVVFVGTVVFEPSPPPTGTTSPTAWDLPALEGDDRIALADFRGTPVVAAFFADWCPHCRRELPHYAALSQEVGDTVAFVGVNSQNSGRGLGFASEMGIDNWPLVRDIGGRNGSGLSNAFGAFGMPLTVFYAADGTVADVRIGPLTDAQLRERIATLFGIST